MSKHLIKEDKVHDRVCHRFMNFSETVEHMNMYYQKYTSLKKENEQLKKKIKSINKILSKDIGYVESFEEIEEILK